MPAVVDQRGREPAGRCTIPSGAASGRPPSSPRPWPSTCCCATTRRAGSAAALAGRRHHARRHGRRRHLRPPRRRLRPLLRRPGVAGAALREDALRPGPAAASLPARLAAHRRGPAPPGGRGDGRLPASATSASPTARYSSAEDADSEGEEGRFYLWTPAQISEVLADDPDLAAAAIGWWNVTEAGNFEGRTILNRMHRPRRPPASREHRGVPANGCSRPVPFESGPASTTRC